MLQATFTGSVYMHKENMVKRLVHGNVLKKVYGVWKRSVWVPISGGNEVNCVHVSRKLQYIMGSAIEHSSAVPMPMSEWIADQHATDAHTHSPSNDLNIWEEEECEVDIDVKATHVQRLLNTKKYSEYLMLTASQLKEQFGNLKGENFAMMLYMKNTKYDTLWTVVSDTSVSTNNAHANGAGGDQVGWSPRTPTAPQSQHIDTSRVGTHIGAGLGQTYSYSHSSTTHSYPSQSQSTTSPFSRTRSPTAAYLSSPVRGSPHGWTNSRETSHLSHSQFGMSGAQSSRIGGDRGALKHSALGTFGDDLFLSTASASTSASKGLYSSVPMTAMDNPVVSSFLSGRWQATHASTHTHTTNSRLTPAPTLHKPIYNSFSLPILSSNHKDVLGVLYLDFTPSFSFTSSPKNTDSVSYTDMDQSMDAQVCSMMELLDLDVTQSVSLVRFMACLTTRLQEMDTYHQHTVSMIPLFDSTPPPIVLPVLPTSTSISTGTNTVFVEAHNQRSQTEQSAMQDKQRIAELERKVLQLTAREVHLEKSRAKYYNQLTQQKKVRYS